MAREREPNPGLLFVALYVLEGALAVAALALYKRGSLPWAEFLPQTAGLLLCAAGVIIVVAGIVCARSISQLRKYPRIIRLTLLVNLITVASAFALAEATVRLLARPAWHGDTVLGKPLLPLSWTKVAHHNLKLLERAADRPRESGLLVPSSALGWTVAPGRRSQDGLYVSNLDGVRYSSPGFTYKESTARYRIALVGDSYTFANDVTFEQSWGQQLNELLGDDVQVLNFGVSGYGVDQAYLRFVDEVRSWRPHVVILAFIAHDLYRSASVYTFVTYPAWELPFSKPRFVLREGRLEVLNKPATHPASLFRTRRLEDLPYLDLDIGYNPAQWEARALHASYLIRLAISRAPRWPRPHPDNAIAAIEALNGALLRAFVESATAAGSRPLVVYLPSHAPADFAQPPQQLIGRRVLATVDSHVDLTPCVAELPPEQRFGADGHYSPAANRRVAECLDPLVAGLLAP